MKKWLQVYARLKNKLSLSNYILLVFLAMLAIVAVISIVGNILTNYPMVANAKWVVLAAMAAVGFWVLRIGRFVESFKTLLFMGVLFFVAWPAWFYGGGDNAITILYMMLIAVQAFLLFEKRPMQWFMVGISAISCIGLYAFTKINPQLVQPGHDGNVVLDSAIQMAMIFAIIALSVSIYTSSYIQQHRQLTALNKRLDKMVNVDELSCVYSRGRILEALEQMITTAQTERLYLFMIDIDRFKQINDEHGHLLGDQIIRHFAAHLELQVGNMGIVGRYGGDEFMILLQGQSPATLKALAQRLVAVPMFEQLSITLSGGLAYALEGDTPHKLIAQADMRLLQSKHNGRNRIGLWDDQTICANQIKSV